MGYNRSGAIRKNRLKRAKREQERLAKKAAGEPTTAGAGGRGETAARFSECS
jgi:hypothetical protein